MIIQIFDYDCDCYWCTADSACGHIAAILLKVQELSPDNFPFEYRDQEQNKDSFAQRLAEIRRNHEEAILKGEMAATKNIINDFKGTDLK